MTAVAVRAVGRAVILAVAAVVALVERDALAGADEVDHAVKHAAQVEGDHEKNGSSYEHRRPHTSRIPPMHLSEKAVGFHDRSIRSPLAMTTNSLTSWTRTVAGSDRSPSSAPVLSVAMTTAESTKFWRTIRWFLRASLKP